MTGTVLMISGYIVRRENRWAFWRRTYSLKGVRYHYGDPCVEYMDEDGARVQLRFCRTTSSWNEVGRITTNTFDYSPSTLDDICNLFMGTPGEASPEARGGTEQGEVVVSPSEAES